MQKLPIHTGETNGGGLGGAAAVNPGAMRGTNAARAAVSDKLSKDELTAAVRLKLQSKAYSDFSKRAALPEQKERAWVQGFSRSEGQTTRRIFEKHSAELKNRLTLAEERGIIKGRGGEIRVSDLAKTDDLSINGYRQSADMILTDSQIDKLRSEISNIQADIAVFRFNEGNKTGYDDVDEVINVKGDVLADSVSMHPRDKMSSQAVLAHEYYGHYLFAPSMFKIGDWRDEMRASYTAALKAPNLSDEDRANLILDAYERAKEAGHYFSLIKKARKIVYGY